MSRPNKKVSIAGPPIGSSFRDPSLSYDWPTVELVNRLFGFLPESGLLDSVRPEGVAAIRAVREFHQDKIFKQMLILDGWAIYGCILTRNGRVVGYESYPGGLSDDSRKRLELLPTLGLATWIDRASWRSPGKGYRIRLEPMVNFEAKAHSVDEVLAGFGLDPSRW